MRMRFVLVASVALALAACNDQYSSSGRHLSPIPPATMAMMAQKGMSQSDPILVRTYKKEAELELWKKGRDGKYALLKTFPICRWSGQLGPKVREGDRQAPEGFYTVTPGLMNPNSSFHLSFDTGYPNAYDRAHGRTGSHLMVHGSCSSRGCFAMTDEAITEIYAIAREAFAGGQRGFHFQSYPFRMTAENLAKHRADPNMPFWKNLKEGSDYFEVMQEEPPISVANMRYSFGAEPAAVAQKRVEDEHKVAELIGKGIAAVRTVYDDGGQHASFRQAMGIGGGDRGGGALAFLDTRSSRNLGDVSRPEALAAGPREIPVEPAAKGKSASPQLGNGKPVASPTRAADTSSPAASTARDNAMTAAESKPLYKRLFGNMFGSSQDSEAAQPSEPAKPTAAPTPPRRGASVPTKPQASVSAPDRRADLAAQTIPGAQPVLPAGTTGFAKFN
jgi:murein L,D-transpeptidase YafK